MGIERRLQWDLFSFLLVDSEFYEDLGQYEPGARDFRSLVEKRLAGPWKLSRQGIWYHVIPETPDGDDEVDLPNQGFKIHCSATSATAIDVINAVVPICVEARTAFKVIVDGRLLDFSNSKNYARVSSGKFITIYPTDVTVCGRLLKRLDESTRGMKGSYILSDRPFNESRVVYYRYGGFRQHFLLNLYGEKMPMIEGPSGQLITDTRTPTFALPDGVTDPFAPPLEAHAGEVELNNRYTIESSLRFSNSGGVYRARDGETGELVVIKEARPHINLADENPDDAIATLEKEARVLQRLQGASCVPRFIETFREWEHFFLVEECIEGVLLANYRALPDVGLVVQRTLTAEGLSKFCRRFGRLACNLITALKTFHAHGVLVGDLSPDNIFIDEESLEVRLIDFEGAFIVGEETPILAGTVTAGFASRGRLEGKKATPEDDCFSLGAVLYSMVLPVQPFFRLCPQSERLFLESIVRDYDLPPQLPSVVLLLMDGRIEEASAQALTLADHESWDWRPQLQAPARISATEVRETLSGIASHILAAADTSRKDRLWPADYRVFLTNPLNLAYGALGTSLFLHRTAAGAPEHFKDWLLGQHIDTETYPPGLFVGSAGVAWALNELGYPSKALEAIQNTYRSPLNLAGPDLFFGAAGVGLASLYFWAQTGDEEFLSRAREIASALAAAKQKDETPGIFWSNADAGHYFGVAHGGSGVALFLLRLHEATGDQAYLDLGIAALEHDIAAAVDEYGLLAWRLSAKEPLIAPYWRYGGAGVGSVLIRYWKVLGQERYRTLAEQAAAYASSKYAAQPSQFVGLSGIGEFMLDMHLATGDEKYMADAWKLAEGVLLYRIEKPEGFAFPGEELLRISTDYGTGSAGIGFFLSRLLEPDGRLFYDFQLPSSALSTE